MKHAVLMPGLHVYETGSDVRVSNQEFAESVLAHVPAGVFYRKAGIIGHVLDGYFIPLTASQVRMIADLYVEPEQHSVRGESRAGSVQYFPCSVENGQSIIDRLTSLKNDGPWQEIPTVNDALPHPAHSLRLLRASVPHPVVTARGKILGNGWHPWHGILVDTLGLDPNAEPIHPHELLSDFSLDPVSEANAILLMLTVLARPAIQGNVPLFAVTASVAGSGKTKLVDEVIGSVTMGRPVPSMVWPGDTEEIRKTITAALLSGSPVLNIDNVPRILDCAVLASFITAAVWRDRILKESTSAELQNALTLVATGNSLQASGELARRSVRIELTPGCDAPEMRAGSNGKPWKHPDLRAEALRMRSGVIAWLLATVQAWVDAGRPASGLKLGSFENWVATVVDPLAFAGLPVLRDIQESAASFDVERRDLQAIYAQWWDVHRDVAIYPKDVLQIADQVEAWQPLIASRHNERGQTMVVGQKLARLVGRVIGDWTLCVENKRNGRAYRLNARTSVELGSASLELG